MHSKQSKGSNKNENEDYLKLFSTMAVKEDSRCPEPQKTSNQPWWTGEQWYIGSVSSCPVPESCQLPLKSEEKKNKFLASKRLYKLRLVSSEERKTELYQCYFLLRKKQPLVELCHVTQQQGSLCSFLLDLLSSRDLQKVCERSVTEWGGLRGTQWVGKAGPVPVGDQQGRMGEGKKW